MDDFQLLRDYVEHGSQDAFGILVNRYLPLVHSAALRQVQNPQLAEEVAQVVFLVLARKASRLRQNVLLPGWLFQTTRFVAARALRTEYRRRRHEQEAFQMQQHSSSDDAWRHIAPLLDEALAGLGAKDRNAMILRFFHGESMQNVGAALGISEDAAKKRVHRAVEKMRSFFARRGMAVSAAVLFTAIGAHSVSAAPIGLASTITAAANSASVGGSIPTLLKTTLKLMAWTKAKTAIIIGVGALLAAGTATVTVNQIQARRTYPWQMPNASSGLLSKVPPQVKILPTKFARFGGWGYDSRDINRRVIGIGAPVRSLLQAAYGAAGARTVFPDELPAGRYDFIANLPVGSEAALQQEIKRKFGLVGTREKTETDVLLLRVKYPNARGLKPASGRDDENVGRPGQYSGHNQPLSSLADILEGYLELPVVDETGLPGRFDIDIRWSNAQPRPGDGQDGKHDPGWQENSDALKQALLDQLGLELVPSRETIEMLTIKKTN